MNLQKTAATTGLAAAIIALAAAAGPEVALGAPGATAGDSVGENLLEVLRDQLGWVVPGIGGTAAGFAWFQGNIGRVWGIMTAVVLFVVFVYLTEDVGAFITTVAEAAIPGAR